MRLSRASKNLLVGLMSGTSADGIDAVVAAISGSGARLKARVVTHYHKPFPPALRERILRVCLHGHVAEICELNFALGEEFAQAALAAIRRAKLKPSDIAAIGSHGQTIHHLPNARHPSTLQIGEAAVIAERTGIQTIADFRVADMAAGGQGAPLVPYTDWVLLTDRKRPRIIQNIGGIGNLTFLPAGAQLDDVLAFDTGPGNMLIDAVVHKLSKGKLGYDKNGEWAARGRVCEPWVLELMRHPYFAKRPPKTTGREDFGESFVEQMLSSARKRRLSDSDLVTNVTAFTATSCANAYKRFISPRMKYGDWNSLQVVLGGGGAKNPVLRAMLQELLGAPKVLTHEDFGLDNSAKEPLAFAILAHETLLGRPGNVPSATGAKRPVVLGKLVCAAPH